MSCFEKNNGLGCFLTWDELLGDIFEVKRKALDEVLNSKSLDKLDKESFMKGWKALAFLNPGLHPDDCDTEYGGWTDDLKRMAVEAFRRSDAGELEDCEMYCGEEALKGVEALRLL